MLQAEPDGMQVCEDGPEHPIWPDDGSLSAKNNEHIAAGLWAVDTINPNVWAGVRKYFDITAADIVIAQEARVRGEAIEQAEQSAKLSKWNCSLQACHVTEKEGESAGAAVCCRAHIGMTAGPADCSKVQAAHPGRVHVRKVGAVCKGGVHIISLYCYDKFPINGKTNLSLLHHVAAITRKLVGPWILAADFNCTPALLEATGFLKLAGGQMHAPEAPTCNGKVYNFFVVSRSLSHAVLGVHTIGDALCSPHSPARLLLRAKPRSTSTSTESPQKVRSAPSLRARSPTSRERRRS